MAETEKYKMFKTHLLNGNVEGVRETFEPEFMEKNSSLGYKPIHLACQEDHFEIVKLFIEKKCNIESQTNEGLRPIHCACKNGKTEIVKILIDKKCNIESKTNKGWGAIHYACQNNYLDIVKLLIGKNCDIESKTEKGFRPIHYACERGHIEILKLLILNNCLIDSIDFDGPKPLDLAKRNGHDEIVKLISELEKVSKQIFHSILKNDDKGFAECSDVHTGECWLEIAWEQKADKIIKYFLNRPINKSEIDYITTVLEINESESTSLQLWKEVLLYKCIRDHHEEGFQRICKPTVINCSNKIIQCSFLELSAENGNFVFVQEILKKSIYDKEIWERAKKIALQKQFNHIHYSISNREYLLKIRKKNNVSILHTAVCDNDPDMMEYILSHNLVDLNDNHETLGTALAFAILLCHRECSSVFERFKINCNTQNKYLQSPLHEAITNGMIEHCQFLIDRVEDIDHKGFMGQVALHCAVMHGYEELCEELVEKGADCIRYMKISQQMTREKDTPISNDPMSLSQRENSLTLCLKMNQTIYPCFLKSLDRNKANSSDAEGNSLLHLTAKLLEPEICDFIIKAGANVDLLNKKGNTPLHELLFDTHKKLFISNENRMIRTVNLFVQSGCDLKKSLKGDMSILHVISKYNSERLLLALLPQQINQLFEINENLFTICLDRKYYQFCESVLNLFPKHQLKMIITTKVIETAIRNDCTKLLKSLIISANDDVQQTESEISLYHLAKLDDKESFERILHIEINNPLWFENGETLLTRLLKENKLDFCVKIMESKTNKKKYINLKNKMNQTPLQVAIETEAMDVVKNHLLFKTDCIDNEDREGRTALMQLFVKISNNKRENLHLPFLNAIYSIISQGGNIYHETTRNRNVIHYCTLPEVREDIETFFKNQRNKFASKICPNCLEREVDSVFDCGHPICQICSDQVQLCPVCNAKPERRQTIKFN